MAKKFRLGSGSRRVQNTTQATQTTQAGPAQAQTVPTNQETVYKTEMEYIKDQDWFRIPVAAILALVVYFSILFFMPEHIEDWQRHGATLGLSILSFAFIGFAQKKPGSLGDAIVTFLALIFAFAMAVCYL